MNCHCRIGKVKMKHSPNLRAIVPRMRGVGTPELMQKYLNDIIKYAPEIAGFAIVAWDFDGYFFRGAHYDKDSFIGYVLAPNFIAEILRRDESANVTREVLKGKL